MALERFAFREEDDGTWTVYDIFTSLPAVVKGIPQVGLDVEDAEDLARLLSYLVDGADPEKLQEMDD